jgi:hypothetical protein
MGTTKIIYLNEQEKCDKMPTISTRSREASRRDKIDYTGASLFVVPSLQTAREALPRNSPEGAVLSRMAAELIRKEKGVFGSGAAPRGTSARAASIDPEDYKDASMWVIPSLRNAIRDLPDSAPEAQVLTGMISSLEVKERGFHLRPAEKLEEAVLI